MSQDKDEESTDVKLLDVQESIEQPVSAPRTIYGSEDEDSAMLRSRAMMLVELYRFKMAALPWSRFWQLSLEAFGLMCFALILVGLLGFSNVGMLALFFCSASLLERHHEILKENRTLVWGKIKSPWSANLLTVLSIFSIFTGIFLAHLSCSALLLSSGREATFSSFYHSMLNFKIAYHHLANLPDLKAVLYMVLAGNFILIPVLLLMGILFRVYGLILALGWCACAWAVEWVRLFQKLDISKGFFVESNGFEILRAGLVTTPYMLFEVMAFVLSAMAGVFISRAFTLYPIGSSEFKRVLKACLWLVGSACVLALVACLFEVGVPYLLGIWKR